MKVLLVIFSSVAVINMMSLALILVLKKPDCIKNRLLAFILAIPAYSILLDIMRYLAVLEDFSVLIALDYIFSYAWPPLVFIYMKMMIGETFRISIKNFLHFIPALMVILFMSAFIILPSGKLILNQFQTSNNPIMTKILKFLI